MSGIDGGEHTSIPKVGHLDYKTVRVQAFRRAKCAFCNQWHSMDAVPSGGPETGSCPGRYGRSRDIAIVVRAWDRGSARQPTDAELKLALKDAVNRKK